MTVIVLPRLAPTTELLQVQCRNPRLSGQVRLALWCWSRIDHHGHARAHPGQLLHDLDLGTPSEVSRVLAKAKAANLIDECSSARCVVLPGHSLAPCPAIHRGGV